MKITFEDPHHEVALTLMEHGDVFKKAGDYYVRSWCGVTVLRKVGTTDFPEYLVPDKQIKFVDQHPGLQDTDTAIVIGKMRIIP